MVTRKNGEEKRPLRERVREAGGWYTWFNTNLIRVAGPPAVSPLEPGPTAEERAERACPLCRQPMNRHEFDRSGDKPLMHCP
ncbi:hypothetical protein [Microbacterium sp. bgisy207]|uniref:hypothetical protein n=1 Tax=Microbacterium sp. bgisy207 TaxID=3413800 RepID=UPI003EBB9DEF